MSRLMSILILATVSIGEMNWRTDSKVASAWLQFTIIFKNELTMYLKYIALNKCDRSVLLPRSHEMCKI